MDRFVFPKSFYDSIKTFKSAYRDALYSGIFEYVFEDTDPTLKTIFQKDEIKRLWVLIKPILSKAKKISDTISRQSQENVKRMSRDTKENVETISRQSPFKEKEKEKDINKPPKSPKGTDADFEKFWTVYPKKVGKIVARKSFDKAIKDVPLHIFLQAIEQQKASEQWKKDNGAYIPNPATWLNQGRWEDEQPVETEPEQETEYHPVVPMTQCSLCGSKNVATKGLYSTCFACGQSFTWNIKTGGWREE